MIISYRRKLSVFCAKWRIEGTGIWVEIGSRATLSIKKSLPDQACGGIFHDSMGCGYHGLSSEYLPVM